MLGVEGMLEYSLEQGDENLKRISMRLGLLKEV